MFQPLPGRALTIGHDAHAVEGKGEIRNDTKGDSNRNMRALGWTGRSKGKRDSEKGSQIFTIVGSR